MVTIKPLTSKNNDFNLDLTAEEVELYKALQGRWNRKVEIKETHETEKVLMHDAAVKKAMLVDSNFLSPYGVHDAFLMYFPRKSLGYFFYPSCI